MKTGLDKYRASRSKYKKLKDRCVKGIPQSVRSQAWMQLSGACKLKDANPAYYQTCLQNTKNIDISKYIHDIQKDLHRQFPNHEQFMKKEGQEMLFNVLKAYAVHYPESGYCQAQCPLAALLLTQMPEEDAFWMLVKISDEYLAGYYAKGLEAVNVDGQILHCLLKKSDRFVHGKLSLVEMGPQYYMIEWFMCVYTRTMPWCTVLRIWDMFLCEGRTLLIKL